jgi:hypothetical protein
MIDIASLQAGSRDAGFDRVDRQLGQGRIA